MINITSLNHHMIYHISFYIDLVDVLSLSATNKALYMIINQDNFWEYIKKYYYSEYCYHYSDNIGKNHFQKIYHTYLDIKRILINIIKKLNSKAPAKNILNYNFHKSYNKNHKSIENIISKYDNKFPLELYLLYRFLNGQQELNLYLNDNVCLFGGLSYSHKYWEFHFHPLQNALNQTLISVGFHPLALYEYGNRRLFVDVYGVLSFGQGAIFSIVNRKITASGKTIFTLYIIKKSLLDFLKAFKYYQFDTDKNLMQYYDTLYRPDNDVILFGLRVRISVVFNPWDIDEKNKYVFGVQIRITSMPHLIHRITASKITWISNYGNQQNELESYGFGGKYPEFYYGCEDYIFEDCIHVEHLGSKLKCRLTFISPNTGYFNINIDEFTLLPPKDSALLDVSLTDSKIQIIHKNKKNYIIL